MGQAEAMDKLIIFFVGAAASVVSEIFWNGESRGRVALWGGAGMLLLRRILRRFPFESRALLCLFGALLLVCLRLVLFLFPILTIRFDRAGREPVPVELPSFSYGLYRFLLIAPAYTIIEYLETFFGM